MEDKDTDTVPSRKASPSELSNLCNGYYIGNNLLDDLTAHWSKPYGVPTLDSGELEDFDHLVNLWVQLREEIGPV